MLIIRRASIDELFANDSNEVLMSDKSLKTVENSANSN